MRHNSFEKNLHDKIAKAIPDVTPGVVVRAYQAGRLICDMGVGTTHPYYDLASLTKIIFTQQAMMSAFDKNLWTLESKVIDFIPNWFDPEMKIRSLLTHTSQLEWWIPFYRDLIKDGQPDDWQKQRSKVFEILNRKSNIKSSETAVYSDLGFITLGYILEKIYQKNLLEVWGDVKEKYYTHTSLDFNVNNQPLFDTNLYAPTELCEVRGRVSRGIVHDENTWSFGGVSSHAGLFGSIEDVAIYGLTIRSQLQGIANYSVRQKTAQLFAARSIPEEVGDWAMGYMIPSVNNPSCGTHFSKTSIGHTGFTGTSCWYDIKSDLLVVILSNRVNYGRDNKAYIQLRPQIHNWIVEGIQKVK